MVTKEQLVAMNGYGELHYTGKHECTRAIGPRGGITETVTRIRLSGQCKTWKRDQARFHQPVKYGFYESGYIDERNAVDWHKVCDCPLKQAETKPELSQDTLAKLTRLAYR